MRAEPVISIAAALQAPHALATYPLPQWEELIRQARRGNLLSRLAQSAAQQGILQSIAPAPRAHLDSALSVAQAQTEAVEREVAYIRNALADVDVDIILLKGAAYLMAGLPAARGRMFSDVDILVPMDMLGAVEAALSMHGWTSAHHDPYDQKYYRQWMHELPPMRHNMRMTVVDVHHAILPRTARLKPDSAALIKASRPIAGADRLRVLCPVDMVLHSATHLFYNEELTHGLRDLADLDSLLRHFGQDAEFWRELPNRATKLDLSRPLYYGLRYASRFFGATVPPHVLRDAEGGRPPRWARPVMDSLYEHAIPPAAADGSGSLGSLSRQALYVRAHWLRMPPLQVARHLVVKALRRAKTPAD